MDKNPIHHQDQPQKPHILEVFKETEQENSHWHKHLQDYDFKIVHITRKTNTPADMLLRPPGKDVTEDSREVALLPPELFINLFGVDSDRSLEHHIVLAQRTMSKVINDWMKCLPIQQDNQVDGPIWQHNLSG